MAWHVEVLDRRVERELDALAVDVRQRFLRIVELIEKHGLDAMHEPHIKHLEGRLWEMRMKGKDGIGRAIYVTAVGQRVVVVHAFVKKTQKTHAACARDCSRPSQGGRVMAIPVSRLKKRWLKEPGFKAGYDALQEEFTIASVLIEARTRAKLSQQQLAELMGTSQSTIARLESGTAKPSISTLERIAKATGTRVRISLEPTPPRNRGPRKAA